MNPDEMFVKTTYPDAGAVHQNKGTWYISEDNPSGNKMRGGRAISGQHYRLCDAWTDAAWRIRGVDHEQEDQGQEGEQVEAGQDHGKDQEDAGEDGSTSPEEE